MPITLDTSAPVASTAGETQQAPPTTKAKAELWKITDEKVCRFTFTGILPARMAAVCIGKPAARARAFFAAANDDSKSWTSRIWNGIRGVGHGALAALGSLPTIAVGLALVDKGHP